MWCAIMPYWCLHAWVLHYTTLTQPFLNISYQIRDPKNSKPKGKKTQGFGRVQEIWSTKSCNFLLQSTWYNWNFLKSFCRYLQRKCNFFLNSEKIRIKTRIRRSKRSVCRKWSKEKVGLAESFSLEPCLCTKLTRRHDVALSLGGLNY